MSQLEYVIVGTYLEFEGGFGARNNKDKFQWLIDNLRYYLGNSGKNTGFSITSLIYDWNIIIDSNDPSKVKIFKTLNDFDIFLKKNNIKLYFNNGVNYKYHHIDNMMMI